MTYISVLSLMQQQAVAFGLPLSDLSLEDLDPERDLLAPQTRTPPTPASIRAVTRRPPLTAAGWSMLDWRMGQAPFVA